MKFKTLFFILTLSAINISILPGQGWEIFFASPEVGLNPQSIIFPGMDNGVRLGVYSGVYPDYKNRLFSFDENGSLYKQDSLLGLNEWRLIYGNKYGESYWIKNGQLKKLNLYNQLEWTYPCLGDEFDIQFLPNGNICFPNQENLTGVIDLINRNGQLISRYYVSPVQFRAGCDNSLLYTLENSNPFLPTRHWIRIDSAGEMLWERDLKQSINLFSGAFSNGSVFFEDYENNLITKLNADGEIEWSHAEISDAPNGNGYFHSLGVLVRSDGSIIISTLHPDDYFMQFVNINPESGAVQWVTRTN